MRTLNWGRRARWLWRLLAVVMLAAAPVIPMLALSARADGIDPRSIVTTDDEAGKQAARAIDKDGGDDRSAWTQIRWERDRDGPDFNTGPATVETTVWVAKDLSSARAIYQEQAAKNPDFPEAFFAHKGPFPLAVSGIGDEVSALSACLDCNAKDEIFVHHRITFRRGIVVGTMYLYGTDKTAPQDLAIWFVAQEAGRVPDSALQAPDKAGQDQSANVAPAPSDGDGQPSATDAPPSAGGSGQPPTSAPSSPLVQANPKDLTVRIAEAGKGAKIQSTKDGTDSRGSWFEVRYEREGTGSRFHQGAVTVYNLIIVAPNVDTAKKDYQDQIAVNEKFPEASGHKVTQRFELKGATELGDEGAGLSACEQSCSSGGEIYVHKRLVTRVANVVSVVYLWGLSAADGTNDENARFFGGLVVDRIHAFQG